MCFLLNAQHYVFEEITKKDGLASNNVNCIFKDSKGYMWFGTGDGGVSRYDGKTFHNYSKTEGLQNLI
jgi:ligand-binding sensor domain-containing protein